MENQIEHSPEERKNADGAATAFDFTYVKTTARIAVYDDLRSAPRVIEIPPGPTNEYIEALASTTFDYAKRCGGSIPYTAIREVSENFIHARFNEIVVSILDEGNTIRFADQGPGIAHKDQAQLPGFTSAIEPMKKYIRGVGSGLPIVKEYLEFSHGHISIEDNLDTGAVVTISLKDSPTQEPEPSSRGAHQRKRTVPAPPLTQRERDFLELFLEEGALGVTDLVNLTDAPQSSTHATLKKLEEAGLIERTAGRKRILTDMGYEVANSL